MLETTSLSAAETAVARHHTYALLSCLLLDGLTADLWPIVQQIPELSATLLAEPDFAQTAAAHQTLFAFNIFPYESVFRDASGLLGGDVTESVSHSYLANGFNVGDDAASPDHIGSELALLAFLCGAEADAWEDNLPLVAQQMRAKQRDFLQQHLLTWLFPLALAVAQQGDAFYTAVFTLTTDLIIDYAQEIRFLGEIGFLLPPAPNLLTNEKTSLKEIAAFLTNPVYSGLVLSRADISRLARAHKLPRGFGKRDLMLHNALQAAVQYDALPDLLHLLRNLIDEWAVGYGRYARQCSSLDPFLQPWQERLTNTKEMLRVMQQHAASFSAE